MINKSRGAAQLNIGKNDVENYKIPKPTKNNLEISKLIDRYLAKLSIEKEFLNYTKTKKTICYVTYLYKQIFKKILFLNLIFLK